MTGGRERRGGERAPAPAPASRGGDAVRAPQGPTLREIVQRRQRPPAAEPAPLWRRLDLGAPVQRRAGSDADPEAIHAAAAAGVATPAQAIPHRAEMEAAFGQDLSFVRAHLGSDADASASAAGAEAFARGDDIVLSAAASKHTVAHEIAHVLQQRGGAVQLAGGVGAAGDAHEREADDIADAVVRGESVAGRLPGGDAAARPVVQRAEAALTHDQFEATMDWRVLKASRRGQLLSAPAYLHHNMKQLRREVGEFLLGRALAPGNAQVVFTEGRQAFLFELSKPLATDDESASIRILQSWVAPASLNELVDRNRALFDDGVTVTTELERQGWLPQDRTQLAYERGPKGPPGWSPSVATALGSELEARLAESMARVSARLVALTADRRRAAAARGEAEEIVVARELAPSHPLDRAVAHGFLPESGEPTVGAVSDALTVDPAARLTYRKVKAVSWLGADGGPWNGLRALDPPDANPEEIARYLWSDRADAYRLKRVGAVFLLSPADAAEIPEASMHRPAVGPGSRFDPVVDQAYLQATGTGAAAAVDAEARRLVPTANAAPPPAAAALLTEWQRVDEQLAGLAVVCQPFAVGGPLDLARTQHAQRAADLSTLDADAAAVRAVVFREQRAILTEAAAEIGNLTTQYEAQRAQAARTPTPDPARQAVSDGQLAVLRGFVRAAAMAHLAQSGREALAEARQLQQTAVLSALEQLLADAITRVEIIRQLDKETSYYAAQSRRVFGAGFGYRQAQLRVRIADLRTQLRSGQVDGQAIQRLYGDIDGFRFETTLVAHMGNIKQAVHAAETLQDSNWVAAAGQIDDLEVVRLAGHDLDFEIRALYGDWMRVQEKAAKLQQELEAAGGAPDADARAATFAQTELATLKQRLDKLGGDERIRRYLTTAYDEIDDAQTKAAILQICVIIGVTIVAAAAGGAASGAVAGMIGEGAGAALAGMVVESATMSVINAALTGDSFVESMTSDFAGNLLTLGALKGLDSLLAGTRVGRAIAAGADDAGRAAYYTAKGVELTGRALVIAGVQFAQMQVESLAKTGRTLSLDEVRQEGIKGIAMMIGTGVLTRLARTPLARFKALGVRGGSLVKQHVELGKLATSVKDAGDPARALELLRAERAHLEAEAATWNDLAGKSAAELHRMGLEPDVVKAYAASAEGHLAGVDALAGGALPAQLGLDPVVPGRVFAGEPAAVASVVASYRERGFAIASEPHGAGQQHTVKNPDGSTALTILERDAGARTPTGKGDDATRRSESDPTDRDPFARSSVAENHAREASGALGINAIVGYAPTKAAGLALLQRLSRGDASALVELGITTPQGATHHQEWGLGRHNGKYVIVAGEAGAVDWTAVAGVEPIAHAHPIDGGRLRHQSDRAIEIDAMVARGDAPNLDALMVFPSAGDIRFLALRRLARHTVIVPYEHLGGKQLGLVEPGTPKGPQVIAEMKSGTYLGSSDGSPPGQVFAATITLKAGDAVLWTGEVYAVHPAGGEPRITFERPPISGGVAPTGGASRTPTARTPDPDHVVDPTTTTARTPDGAGDPEQVRLPEYHVTKDDRPITHWTSKEWTLEFMVTMPDGSARSWGDAKVLIDEHRRPIGPPALFLEARVGIDGAAHALRFFDAVEPAAGGPARGVGAPLKATEWALRQMLRGYEQAFGQPPALLKGDLILDNRTRFQKAYVKALGKGLRGDAAAQAAIRETPFGSARAELGYDVFEIQLRDTQPTDLGPGLGVHDVPRQIDVTVRRSQPGGTTGARQD